MSSEKSCMILGAGIAGVTAAIGLKKLGFGVTLFYKRRPFTAYEGFSEKTKEGLLSSGCSRASRLLEIESVRNSNWAEASKKINYEYVVCRDALDRALLEDAGSSGVVCVEATVVGGIDCSEARPKVGYKYNGRHFEAAADFIVDARGRFTPFKEAYVCGPKSFSILQELEIEAMDEKRTSIDSTQDGWVWQAYVGDKRGYVQFTCDESTAATVNSFDDLLGLLTRQNAELWSLKSAKPVKRIVKRDAYSKLHREIINEKMMLVGDAASSIDPLSGNGAFQAMSMSSIAPFVVNTILEGSADEKQTAIDFYKERVRFIFDKFSKVGRDFYRLEQRYESGFWQDRQSWPSEVSVGVQTLPRIEKRAVVKVPNIHAMEVVITKSNPMGVCFYGDLEVVGLARFCIENTTERSLAYFNDFCREQGLSAGTAGQLEKWLFSQDFLADTA